MVLGCRGGLIEYIQIVDDQDMVALLPQLVEVRLEQISAASAHLADQTASVRCQAKIAQHGTRVRNLRLPLLCGALPLLDGLRCQLFLLVRALLSGLLAHFKVVLLQVV